MTAESEHHSNFASAHASAGRLLDRPDASGSGESDPFARLDWFALLHQHCLADRQPIILGRPGTPWLFLMQDGPSRACALANWYSFHWSPSALGPSAADDAALAVLFSQLRSRCHTLRLGPLWSANAMADRVAAAMRQAGWHVTVDESGHNHWLETAGRDFAQWWSERPGALRSTVARKAKKQLVVTSIADRFSDQLWDDYELVYRQSWKPVEETPGFLRELARRESEAGHLRLGFAHVDGIPVAAQFWICDGGTAYIHKLAHVSGHDALSPGTLLTYAMFQHAFDVDRVQRIDFGTGDDGYKRDWMESSAPLITLTAHDPRQPGAWTGMARQGLSRLAAAARGR